MTTRTFPDIVSTLDQVNSGGFNSGAWAEVEVHLCAGDSQATGQDSSTPASVVDTDTPLHGILEVSWGRARTGRVVSAEGTLIPAVNPLQQDNIGTGVGPMLAYLKRRKQMFPGIKKMILVGRAVGGSSLSASGGWSRDDTMWTELRDAANAVLAAEPDAVPISLFFSQGTVDATQYATYSARTFLTELMDAVAGWREEIHDAANMAVVMPHIADFWRKQGWFFEDYQKALEEFERKDDLVTLISVAGLTSNDGDRHFTGEGYIQIGQAAAVQIAPLVQVPPLKNYRVRWDPLAGRFMDIYGSGAEIIGAAFTTDATRGPVLNFTSVGALTTARLNGQAYSFSAKIRPTSSAGFRNICGFKGTGETVGHSLSLNGSFGSLIHEGLTAIGNKLVTVLGGEPALNTWHTVGCSYGAGAGTLYFNGANEGSTGAGATPATLGDRGLCLAAFDPNNLGDNEFVGQMDDICIYSRTLSDAAFARFNLG